VLQVSIVVIIDNGAVYCTLFRAFHLHDNNGIDEDALCQETKLNHGVISQNITRSEPTGQPSGEELGHVADGPINQTKSTSASEHAMLESEGEKRSDRVPQVQAAGSMQPNEPLHKISTLPIIPPMLSGFQVSR
jgi:hypothetical protein